MTDEELVAIEARIRKISRGKMKRGAHEIEVTFIDGIPRAEALGTTVWELAQDAAALFNEVRRLRGLTK